MEKKQIIELFDERIKQLSEWIKDKKTSKKARAIWESGMDELNAMKQTIRNLKD